MTDILSTVPPVRKAKYGWNPDLPDRRDRKYSAPLRVITRLPVKADLRPWMPPPYRQGEVGSCVPCAVAAVCEYVRNRHVPGAMEFTPSRLFMYYNAREFENSIGADDGCQIRDVIRSLAVYGVCPEKPCEGYGAHEVWDYDTARWDVRPPEACYVAAARRTVTAAAKLVPTLAQIQGCLADGNPVVFGFSVYESFESEETKMSGRAGVPGINERCYGGHAAVLVGYDDDDRYFTFRNSWGEEWGDKGYGYLPYEFVTDPDCCGDYWMIKSVS
jgi:C1A family cysteine protease